MPQFSRFPPPAALSQYIHGYWFLHTGASSETIALVPDGYPEILFVRKGHIQYKLKNESWNAFAGAGVLGQVTAQFECLIAPHSEILFIKFHPWSLHVLLQTPMHLLNNGITALSDLKLDAAWGALSDWILNTEDQRECLSILNAFFYQKLALAGTKGALLQHCIQNIFQSSGTIPLDALFGKVRVSKRYIQRLFKDELGVGPKHYARIIRVKKASIHILDATDQRPLVQIASQLDYFDQSHFLKDFKSIVGKSPTQFLKQESGFSEETLTKYLEQWAYS